MSHDEGAEHQDPMTLIYWDWDDTLLCSSYLSSSGYRLDSNLCGAHDVLRQLKELESCVINALNLAFTLGQVTIITNAETGWVQLSAEKFLPGVLPLLSKARIVSARSTYESRFPDNPLSWKLNAFQESLNSYSKYRTRNVLSFGDSHVEREAVRTATRGLPGTRCKSIKFAERPSVEQLQRQIELVTNCFQYIYSHEGDLDLCMSLSQEVAEPSHTQHMLMGDDVTDLSDLAACDLSDPDQDHEHQSAVDAERASLEDDRFEQGLEDPFPAVVA
jgi:hypothetical protein